jgi:hypothetical protein
MLTTSNFGDNNAIDKNVTYSLFITMAATATRCSADTHTSLYNPSAL